MVILNTFTALSRLEDSPASQRQRVQADDSSKIYLELSVPANSCNDSEFVLVRTVSSPLAHVDF